MARFFLLLCLKYRILAFTFLCFVSEARAAQKDLPWVTDEVRAPRVGQHVFASDAAKSDVSFHVYTPLAYDREPEMRFPVLYWLHGTAGGVNGVLPVARLFHAAMQSGDVPPMLVVFVNGLPARLWCDSKDGSAPVETVFIKELIPHIDKNFRTIASREGRIIEGFSMGGYGAGRLGFKYPELFAGVSMLAGGPLDLEFEGPRAESNPGQREQVLRNVCSDDMEYFRQQSPWTIAETNATKLDEYKTCIRQVVGDRDFTLDLNTKFHERLADLKIGHDFTVLPNTTHDTKAVLELLGKKNGEFYRSALAGTSGKSPDRGRRTPTGESVTFDQNGQQREYRIHVPGTNETNPAGPLLIFLHGGGGNSGQGSAMGLTPLADKHGFVVVYPNAINGHWNDGRESQRFVEQDQMVDDVKFVTAIVERVKQQYKIDSNRVFVAGISNGGFMTQRLAMEHSEIFSAAGIFVASMGEPLKEKFDPNLPVSMFYMNGTDDPLVPYDGGEVKVELFPRLSKLRGESAATRGNCISTNEAVELWVKKNGASNDPLLTRMADKNTSDGCTIEHRLWKGGQGETAVSLYKVIGGG